MTVLSHSITASSLTALTEAAAAISSTLDLQVVLSTIARLACEVTRAEASGVFFLDPTRRKLVVVAATGNWREALVGREFDANVGIPGEVARTGEPMLVPDVDRCSKFCKETDDLSSMRTRSVIAVSMTRRGETIGVVEVVNRRDEGAFTDHDVKVLQIFSTLAASASWNARKHQDLKDQLVVLRESQADRDTVIGESAPWKRVLELCRRVAPSNATVLLLGETGTGKELTARRIHDASRRRDGPFVAVNCAAIPETLLESELFGHEKGAFSGAHLRRRGWFEAAHRGTLLLDEIGEVSRPMQATLLRVLQEKRLVRVGGTQTIACDARIIAATNRNLKNMMIDGLFREDLYYRLSVFPIELPALRDRREDIPLFVEHIVDRARRECGISDLQVAAETMNVLTEYAWPGNIRELQNVVERSVLMSDGPVLLPHHLPSDIPTSVDREDSSETATTLHCQERASIVKALNENDWNQTRAAEVLGVTRYYVRHRMHRYGIKKPADSRQP